MKYLLTLLFIGLFLVAVKTLLCPDNRDMGRRQWIVVKEIEDNNLTAKILTTKELFTIQTDLPENLLINFKNCSTKDFQIGDTIMFVKLRAPAK